MTRIKATRGVIDTLPGSFYKNEFMRTVFLDKKVRQAFAYIMDREDALAFGIGGYGVIGSDQPIPPYHAYANPNLVPREQNIELAKKLLSEAGILPVARAETSQSRLVRTSLTFTTTPLDPRTRSLYSRVDLTRMEKTCRLVSVSCPESSSTRKKSFSMSSASKFIQFPTRPASQNV